MAETQSDLDLNFSYNRVSVWSFSVFSQGCLKTERLLNELLPTLSRRWWDNWHEHPSGGQNWWIFLVRESCSNVVMEENKLFMKNKGEREEKTRNLWLFQLSVAEMQNSIKFSLFTWNFRKNAMIFRIFFNAILSECFLPSLAAHILFFLTLFN